MLLKDNKNNDLSKDFTLRILTYLLAWATYT